MADISQEIANINTKTRGEDVRDALIDACKKIAVEILPDPTEVDYVLTVNALGKWEVMEWT